VVLPNQILQHVVQVRRKASKKTHRDELVSPHPQRYRKRSLRVKNLGEVHQPRLVRSRLHKPHQGLAFASQPFRNGTRLLERAEGRFVIQDSVKTLFGIKRDLAPCQRGHLSDIDGLPFAVSSLIADFSPVSSAVIWRLNSPARFAATR